MAVLGDMMSFPEPGCPVLKDMDERISAGNLYYLPLKHLNYKIDVLGNNRLFGSLLINGGLSGVTTLAMGGALSGVTTMAANNTVTLSHASAPLILSGANAVFSMTGRNASIGTKLFRIRRAFLVDLELTNRPTVMDEPVALIQDVFQIARKIVADNPGTQGPQGAQGAASTVPGPQGAQGASVTGPQGAQGYQGESITGPQGAQGAASTVPGPQGAQGASVTGPQGAQGYQGESITGPQGAQGAASTVPGPQGAQGASVTGPQGAQGFQGESITGPQGAQGAASTVPGPQGAQGASVTGPQGAQGYQGESITGPQGAQGASVTGPQGAQGFQGESITGPQGAQGAASTVPGPQGAQGASVTGPQGAQGFQGESITGPQGAQGAASTVPGPQGPQGYQGADGGGSSLDINSLTAKTTPVDADITVIEDSAASWAKKKLSWANIKATLKTYFDTLYVALSGATFTGTITTPSITLPTNGQILLTIPSTDGHATGNVTNAFNSGYSSSAIGDLVYLDSSSTWQKCDMDTSAATYSGLLGIALEVKASGNALRVALSGSFVYASAFPALTVGGIVYMSDAGAITQTQPSGEDDSIRMIGWAVHADKIYFYPSPDYIVHT
jgi:hypothetical protein